MKEKPESLMAVHTLPNLNKYLKKLYSKKEEFALMVLYYLYA